MKMLFYLITSFISLFSMVKPIDNVVINQEPITENIQVFASEEFSLKNRYKVVSVNDIFADNILLALKYMDGDISKAKEVNWEEVRKPDETVFELKPGETFAFHDNLTTEYKDSVVQTTNAHFIASEGFKSDGFIVGDGVCHLASFINVAATQAGLDVYAPVRHDFAQIPDITREFGTSINSGDTRQNMYITNNKENTIAIIFEHSSESVKITVKSA